jgi:two-component system, NtrC family, sensor kinase
MRLWRSLISSLRTGLTVKLAVCLILSAAAIFTVFCVLNLRQQRRNAEELILQSAERLSDIILRSTRHEMLRNDRDALFQSIRDVGKEPGIRRVRIFNKEGRIRFSTDSDEIGQVVDKHAEACYACHAQGVPLSALKRPDHARTFTEDNGRRVFAMIRPIRNEPSCSSAACHAHPPEKKVLGVLDTQFALDAVDAQAAQSQRVLVAFAAAGVLVFAGISVLFVWLVLHRPIRHLIAGTHRLAGGDWSHRLEIHSNDELGEMAREFNRMTDQLAGAHGEITEWAQTLEERVRRKSEELDRAHSFLLNSEKLASLGKLAATVAHEVNNPLFGILTYSRLCLKEVEKAGGDVDARERMRVKLEIIERESRRCGDIIKNLLTFARQAPRRREPNDVNALVERALTLVRHQLKLQNIALETDLATLPEVSCDAGQVQQIALILLTNACEAMPEGGGKLWVKTEQTESGIRIRVKDNGPGIPAEVLPHIFEPFFTTKEEKLRTGLGLAVAKSIAEQHGGSIQVQEVIHGGAEFVVSLPLQSPVGESGGGAVAMSVAT